MPRIVAFLAAAAAVVVPGIAAAAEPPCLTAREFSDLSQYALPSLITGTAERCSAALPADAYLRRNGSDLAARYAAGKPSAWPGAKSAFMKLSGGINPDATGLFRTLPDDKLQPMVDALVEGMIGQQVQPDSCATIDKAVRLLSPLPPHSTAELIALAIGLGSTGGGGKVGRIALCPAA
jgi:hypothetical protein